MTYFRKLRNLIFPAAKFAVQIFHKNMRNRNLEIMPSKNKPWSHVWPCSFARDRRPQKTENDRRQVEAHLPFPVAFGPEGKTAMNMHQFVCLLFSLPRVASHNFVQCHVIDKSATERGSGEQNLLHQPF